VTQLQGNLYRYCPYCQARGWAGDKLDVWHSRSASLGTATRWTRCESCKAMWREVYDYDQHVYRYAEHWKPQA